MLTPSVVWMKKKKNLLHFAVLMEDYIIDSSHAWKGRDRVYFFSFYDKKRTLRARYINIYERVRGMEKDSLWVRDSLRTPLSLSSERETSLDLLFIV